MHLHGLEKMLLKAFSRHVVLPSHLYSKDKEAKCVVVVVKGKTRYLMVPGPTGKILFYTSTRPEGLGLGLDLMG